MHSHGNRMHSHDKQRNGCQKFDSETETNRYVTINLKLIIEMVNVTLKQITITKINNYDLK